MAIASGDAEREYYLLKVKSNGTEVLQNVTTDGWENTFPPGAEVVCGSFYLAKDYVQRAYTLDEENEGIVYIATIRFICSDFAIINMLMAKTALASLKNSTWTFWMHYRDFKS